MVKLYTVSKTKTWSCGSDYQLLIAKLRLNLKKVGEVMNRFKRLDLVARVMKNYGHRFITFYRRQ